MNREILFRGKRKDNNEWVYGNLIYDNVSDKCWIDLSISEDETDSNKLYVCVVEVIPETVSQYTNFDDKNGKKIFENDIVHYNDFTSSFGFEVTGKIVFTHNIKFEIKYYDKILKKQETRPLVCNEHPIFTHKKVEVIGNIIDNPELLDKEVK